MKQIKKVIIFGTGGTSRDILDIIERLEYQCMAFLDDDKNKWGKSINGIKIVGPLSETMNYEDTYFINGIGSPSSFLQKETIIKSTNLDPDRFITLIDPSAIISKSAFIGIGSVIFPNVVISSNVTIGNHVEILANSVIGHDSVIGDYVTIASGASTSGSVTLGKLCYLGTGSLIKEGVVVEPESMVGMGSVVLDNIEKNSVYVGNPARFLRSN